MSRKLGLDVGDRRIGVAISDADGMIAVPIATVHKKDAESAILAIVELAVSHNAEGIVVGFPTLMSGEVGEQAHKVEEFVEHLKQHTLIPVEWWDERLSTVAAEKMMRDTGAKRSSRDANRDSLAAALILQSYLDNKRMLQP